MKINEIPKYKEMFSKPYNIWKRGYARENRLLAKYENEEVIAYRESFMGICFLFKGKIDFFAFSIIDEPFTKYIDFVNVYRIDVEKVKKMFGKNGEGKLIILNEDLYRKFNADLLLRGLKDE